MMQHLNLKY